MYTKWVAMCCIYSLSCVDFLSQVRVLLDLYIYTLCMKSQEPAKNQDWELAFYEGYRPLHCYFRHSSMHFNPPTVKSLIFYDGV